MYIIVTGGNETSLRIAEQLMTNHDVVVLSDDKSISARLERLDIHLVDGSPTSASALQEAMAQKADYLIAATESDERNIVSCLAAERLGTPRTICFLMASEGLEAEGDEVSLAESIGIDVVLRPQERLADEIVEIVTVPGALDVRSLRGGRVHLMKAPVEEGSRITKGRLGGAKLPKNVRLVFVQREDKFLVPSDDLSVKSGDRVTAVGTRRGLTRLMRRELQGPTHAKELKRAIVAGGGTVGLMVARGLIESGWKVKVIEIERKRCEEISQKLDCLVLHGDSSDLDLLIEERIDTSSALVAVTNNDEKNLLVSLLAKHVGVPRIITRADRLANERMFEKVGVDVALSARGAAIRAVVRDIVEGDTEHVADLEHGDVEILDFELPRDFPDTLVGDIEPPCTATVGAVLRGKRTLFPTSQDVLRPRDHVIVICRTRDEARARDYFMNPRRESAAEALVE